LWLILGLIALTVGAEWLVRGAAHLAVRVGISPLVVGLTVVAFGTSAPELVVSLGAVLKGQVDVAVGNVVGSNICNLLLILGLTAVVAPLVVSPQLLRFDLPLLILVTLVVWALCQDQMLSRYEGAGLFAGVIVYTAWSVIASRWKTRRELAAAEANRPEGDPFEVKKDPPGWWGFFFNLLLVIVGLVLLTNGAAWFIDSAIIAARYLGVSELVIGLTLVAAGTSLPEVATSVVAAFRGQRDIAVGNVIGSNLFNLLSVLGASAAVSTAGLTISPLVLNRDLPLMVAATLLCIPVFWTGKQVSRVEGGIFLIGYLGYLTYLAYAQS
jgi:cation:H+ antiporter